MKFYNISIQYLKDFLIQLIFDISSISILVFIEYIFYRIVF